MRFILKNLSIALSLFVLFGCGGSKSGSGSSSMNSALSTSYKYFVYVANYTDNTISGFSMNRDTGALIPVETTSAGEGGNPLSLAISPNGEKLYIAKSASGTISNLQVFNINKLNGSLTPFQSIRVNNNSQGLSSVSASLDGRFVYLSSYDGDATVYFVSALTGNLILFKNYSISMATKSNIHPNGELLFWMNNSNITLWPINKTTGEIVFPGEAYTATTIATQLTSIAVTPDGSRMYASYYVQGFGLINSYNLDLTNKTASSIGMASSGNSVGGIAISNFGKTLIATEPNSNLLNSFLINSSTGALTKVDSKATENYPQQVIFFPDGKYALVINKTSKSVSTFLVEYWSIEISQFSSNRWCSAGHDYCEKFKLTLEK